MTLTFSLDGEAPADLLVEAEELLTRTAAGFFRLLTEVEAGEVLDKKATTQEARDLRSALEMVMGERARVDRFRKQADAVVGGGALDLDAARDEIGRRLARLRAAGGGG
jgi:hypothetical protein